MTRRYSKKPGNLPLRDEKRPAQKLKDEESLHFEAIPQQDYTKTAGDFDPSLVMVFSGGTIRERNYLWYLEKNRTRFPRISVEFVADDKSIKDLTDTAISKKNELLDKSLNDSFYLITDVDDFYNDILKYRLQTEKEDIKFIISNPCFELWLHYSYSDNQPDFEIPANKSKISQIMKQYLNDTHKGGINPKNALLNLNQAIENSEKNFSLDNNGIPKLFSTQMHEFAKCILPLIDKELDSLKKDLSARRYKKP